MRSRVTVEGWYIQKGEIEHGYAGIDVEILDCPPRLINFVQDWWTCMNIDHRLGIGKQFN